jgi:hypothetical protein
MSPESIRPRPLGILVLLGTLRVLIRGAMVFFAPPRRAGGEYATDAPSCVAASTEGGSALRNRLRSVSQSPHRSIRSLSFTPVNATEYGPVPLDSPARLSGRPPTGARCPPDGRIRRPALCVRG